MSFFKNIFGDDKPEELPKVHWYYLESMAELDDIDNISMQKPVAIFKHSTRCSISRFSLKQFENEHNIETEKLELYFLDLLAHRDISDAIAMRYQVQHQSPQLIVIKDGKAVYNVSHSDIDAEKLKEFV
ncbi:bacillithiol system redox-active protein YtxJ [Flavobacterium sp. 3HN19-14]|uniref:bacillithiol system redox-active protein YtxJ n=1 Tax=Flavobacterium sp. 3HN19-14 TaxID=3448133 RepID=UPI003EE1BCD7